MTTFPATLEITSLGNGTPEDRETRRCAIVDQEHLDDVLTVARDEAEGLLELRLNGELI